MRVGRTVPPAAAPLTWTDLWHGIGGAMRGARTIRELEQEIQRHFRVNDVFTMSSGKAALTLVLMALKSMSPRRDVVIPAFTCFSVAAAVVQAGLNPVLCDIDATSFDFDDERLEQTVTENTLCVVAHHLFGMPAAIGRIRTICRRHGALVVEDAAQAMGAKVGGRPLGTLGDVGIFSLGRGKNITCGSGGIIVTSSACLADAIARHYAPLRPLRAMDQVKEFARTVLMTIFIRPSLYWIPAGLPFLGLGVTVFPKHIPLKRLSAMQAGLLRNWRIRLSRSNEARAATASYFTNRLSLTPVRTGSHPFLRLPIVAPNAETRARVFSMSNRRGLGVSVAYPTPINEIPEIRSAFAGQRFPSADAVAQRLLTLPTHHWVSERDKLAIAELCRPLSAA